MTRKQRKRVQMAERRATPPVEPAKPADMRISVEAELLMRAKPTRAEKRAYAEMFRPYEPPKGVLPKGMTGKTLAMDAGFDYNSVGNLGNVNEIFNQGYAWPGFTVLADWAQIPEFRRPAETYAREMTRKWIKIQATGEEDKSEKIKVIEAEFKRLNVRAVFREAIEQDGKFGRSQIFVDMGMTSDQLDTDELKSELVESKDKVGLDSLKRLTVIEPIWSYPNRYNANDPLDPTFYKPISWFVMGKEIHSSRLLTIITRDVPDILKPAYAFSGLSLSQMMKPYVDNWLRTRQSVSDLIHAFTVWTLKTNMAQVLNGGGAENLFRRLQVFNMGRDNHGVMAIDKDTEDFSNISASLAGLDKLQAQSQEQQCAPSGLPLVYLTGITPAGLNASSQGEIEVFQDTTAANQEVYTPALSKILNLVQLSKFGEIDPEIGFIWNPLKVTSELDKANIRKAEAETDQVHIDSGVLFPEEVRARIAGEEDSPYSGIDLNRDLPEPVTHNGQPGPNEEGLDPLEQQPQADPGSSGGAAMDSFALDADWEEGKHTRAENGEFGSGGSSSGKKKLTSNEKSTLSSYSGDDFLRINSELREGNDSDPSVQRLDSAIEKSPLTSGTTLYRGMSRESAKKLFPGGQITRGMTVSDPAFASTSKSSSVAGMIGLGGVVLKIETGANATGIDMTEHSRNTHEKEVLLPRNAKMKVMGTIPPKSPGDPIVVRVSYGD